MNLSSRTRGILWEINATICFTFLVTLVKYASKEVPSPVVAFLRTLIGAAFTIPIAYRQGVQRPSSGTYQWYILRSLCAMATVNAVFYASSTLPLSIFTAISYTEPMIQLVLAILFFGATVTVKHWFLIGLGYAGVFIIAYSKMTTEQGEVQAITSFLIGVIVALLASLFISLIKAITKRLTNQEPPQQVLFYSNLLNIVFGSLTLVFYLFLTNTPFPETILLPSATCLLALLGIGFSGFLLQYSMTKALSLTEMHILSPITYLRLLFALPVSYYFYAEVPTWTTLGGSLIIIGANFFLLQPKEK
ncbi:MAG: DMT family transporter [Bacteroidota bacterium]